MAPGKRFRWLALAATGALATLVALAFVISGDTRSGRGTLVIEQNSLPGVPSSLTMQQAWDVAAPVVRGWGAGWNIAALYSTDVNDSPTRETGRDGRRRTWQADAVSRDGMVRWLRITDGRVVDAIEPGTPQHPQQSIARPAVDSPALATTALAFRPQLEGGLDKAIGWHFSLGVDASSGETRAAVSGSYRGSMARVEIDPATGDPIRARQLVVSGGGLLISRDSGVNWEKAELSGVVVGAAADSARGANASFYAATVNADGISLWRSLDEGMSWGRAAVLPSPGETVAFDLAIAAYDGAERALISTRSGLWSVDLSSLESQRQPVPADGLVTEMEVDQGGRLHALVVFGPGNAAHYVLLQLGWELVGENNDRLTAGPVVSGFRQDAEVGTGQGGASAILKAPTGAASFAATTSGILRSTDGGLSWQMAREGAADALAASPTDRAVLLASVFPDLIVRSEDQGTIWRVVHVIKGSRFGAQLIFLSDHVAVGILSGAYTWREI